MDYFLVILSIISVFITILAQIFENWLYIKYINIPNMRKISGCEASQILLEKNNIRDIKIKKIKGYLTDHYDAKKKEIELSEKVYNSKTVGAVAIASRETCKAIQYNKNIGISNFERFLLCISNLSSPVAYLSIIIGIFFSQINYVWIGIIIELILLAFQLITLPIRIDTSKKALNELDYSHILNSDELKQSKEILNSIMISSVAKLNTTLLHLFRLISMIGKNNHFVPKEILYYFWIFVISGFLGFVIETVWCFIEKKRIESRKGVIHEPLIPIYGISGLLIVVIIKIFEVQSNIKMFLIGFVVNIVMGLFCSLLQEKIWGEKRNDFPKSSFRISKRINLFSSFLFGIASVVSYKYILLPVMNMFIEMSATGLIVSLTLYRFIYMIYDFAVSAISIHRMKERRNNIKRKGIFWDYIDEKYSDDFLETIYVNMISVKTNKI